MGNLPLQSIARQSFISLPLPHKAPETVTSFFTLFSLNFLSHFLQVIPGYWKPITELVLSQKAWSIEKQTSIDVPRHGHQFLVGFIATNGFFIEFSLIEIWCKILCVLFQNSWPDHIDGIHIGTTICVPILFVNLKLF